MNKLVRIMNTKLTLTLEKEVIERARNMHPITAGVYPKL